MEEFYRVIFFDKNQNMTTIHYVFTANINNALKQICAEAPYINALSYKKVAEEDLPDLVVVIRR